MQQPCKRDLTHREMIGGVYHMSLVIKINY